jgi:hypothetical protein
MGTSPGMGKKEFLPLPRPAETRMGNRAAERRARPILRPFFDVTIDCVVILVLPVTKISGWWVPVGIYSERCDDQAMMAV